MCQPAIELQQTHVRSGSSRSVFATSGMVISAVNARQCRPAAVDGVLGTGSSASNDPSSADGVAEDPCSCVLFNVCILIEFKC